MSHWALLEAARAEKSDVTLQALVRSLFAERGSKPTPSMMSRFFRRIGVTAKKTSSHASRIAWTSVATANDGEPIRPTPWALASSTTRDQDQYDPPARLAGGEQAARRQGPAAREDRDFPRRIAQRPHRCAPPVRRAHQQRALPRLCRTGPRADAEAGRRRGPWSTSAPTKERRCGKAIRAARLVFLPKYSPDPTNSTSRSPAQFKTLLRKAEARSYEAISDACGKILAQYLPAEMRRIPQERRIRVDPKAARSSLRGITDQSSVSCGSGYVRTAGRPPCSERTYCRWP